MKGKKRKNKRGYFRAQQQEAWGIKMSIFRETSAGEREREREKRKNRRSVQRLRSGENGSQQVLHLGLVRAEEHDARRGALERRRQLG